MVAPPCSYSSPEPSNNKICVYNNHNNYLTFKPWCIVLHTKILKTIHRSIKESHNMTFRYSLLLRTITSLWKYLMAPNWQLQATVASPRPLQREERGGGGGGGGGWVGGLRHTPGWRIQLVAICNISARCDDLIRTFDLRRTAGSSNEIARRQRCCSCS